jgi:uncharacterized protein (TIGR03435 family)
MRTFAWVGVVCLMAGAVFSQSVGTAPTTAPAPKFEIADVHPTPNLALQYLRGPFYRAGRYELRVASMVGLICTAYGIDNDKVLGGPNWLENDFFDIVAKGPPDAKPETVKLMLQSLLADRFKLKLHYETRPSSGHALTVGKKQGLKEADGSGETGCKVTAKAAERGAAPGDGPQLPTIVSTCRNTTMAAFAEGLRNLPGAQQYLGRNPVVDRTELKGAWNFTFQYTPNLVLAQAATGGITATQAASSGITLFEAIDKQLGLKLEPAEVSATVIVVDSANEKPAGNPPGVAEQLAAVPTEFEVADIKPSAPGTLGPRMQRQPGGRVNIVGATLKSLVQQIWSNTDNVILSDEMIVGAPKSMENDRWDILAKAPIAAATPGVTGPSGSPEDIDTVWVMLRSLLAERFKLAFHTEERPLNAYKLVAGKPKMNKADPSKRTGCREGVALNAKDPRVGNPILDRLLLCQNITMTEFANRLMSIANGYFQSPVVDATGLEGRYDFSVSFSRPGMVQVAVSGAGRAGDAAPASAAVSLPVAPEPNGAISIFDAVESQLGLKLVREKRPLPVLVIDHVEPKPTEN